jgi:hypothetical protein
VPPAPRTRCSGYVTNCSRRAAARPYGRGREPSPPRLTGRRSRRSTTIPTPRTSSSCSTCGTTWWMERDS